MNSHTMRATKTSNALRYSLQKGLTALIIAAGNGDYKAVRLLLDYGASQTQKSKVMEGVLMLC